MDGCLERWRRMDCRQQWKPIYMHCLKHFLVMARATILKFKDGKFLRKEQTLRSMEQENINDRGWHYWWFDAVLGTFPNKHQHLVRQHMPTHYFEDVYGKIKLKTSRCQGWSFVNVIWIAYWHNLYHSILYSGSMHVDSTVVIKAKYVAHDWVH